jgi:hypothetical protein
VDKAQNFQIFQLRLVGRIIALLQRGGRDLVSKPGRATAATMGLTCPTTVLWLTQGKKRAPARAHSQSKRQKIANDLCQVTDLWEGCREKREVIKSGAPCILEQADWQDLTLAIGKPTTERSCFIWVRTPGSLLPASGCRDATPQHMCQLAIQSFCDLL